MLDEAIKSGRSLFLSVLFVFLVWAISWPSANFKLYLSDYVKNLEAWLILEQYFSYNENLSYFIFKTEPGLEKVCDLEFEREPLAPQGGVNVDIIPLELIGKWHNEPVSIKICLNASQNSKWEMQHLTENARYFEIAPQENSILPFGDYDLIIFDDSISYVIPRSLNGIFKDSLRGLKLLKDGKITPNHPVDWDSTSTILKSYGYSGLPEPKLKLHSAYHALIKASDIKSKEESVSIFGLKLTLDLFVSLSGLIMGLLSITLIGPIINIKKNYQESHKQPWILVVNTRSLNHYRFAELSVFMLSLLWALCPLYIMIIYLTKFNDLLSQLDILAILSSILGFTVAIVINISFVLELKKIRSLDTNSKKHNELLNNDNGNCSAVG